jgi:hypothetical protein
MSRYKTSVISVAPRFGRTAAVSVLMASPLPGEGRVSRFFAAVAARRADRVRNAAVVIIDTYIMPIGPQNN